MNDQQSIELVRQLTRIADALERIAPAPTTVNNKRNNAVNVADIEVLESLARAPKGLK